MWLLCLVCTNVTAQTNDKGNYLQGNLQLDSVWQSVVYLSHIPTLNDLYTMSNEMIIAESPIDSTGFFSFPIDYLPGEDHLYRLHISKIGAPAASLIIGGDEENHIFLIVNSNSNVQLSNKNPEKPFQEYTVNGYRPNQGLQVINQINDSLNISNATVSSLKREFVSKAVYEKLRAVADTSTHPIVSLYALHHSKFEATFLDNQQFYKDYLKKWEAEDSPYFESIRAKLPYEQKAGTLWFFIIGACFFVLGIMISYYFIAKRKRSNNHLKTLSVQERKIFRLIQSGKSNKEISDEYNIGLSTVKSHVSSIYSKLQIKSRKDALDY